MGDFLRALSSAISGSLRAIAADSPIAVAISVGFGFLEKIIITYLATTSQTKFFFVLDSYPVYAYIFISLAFILIPMHLGWSAVPRDIAESAASLEKIIKMGGFTKAQQRAYWADLVKVYIQRVGDYRDDGKTRSRQGVEVLSRQISKDLNTRKADAV